jgi:hypothetical protein
LVEVRSPSLAETETMMWYWCVIELISASVSGSSSRNRDGKPSESSPKARLAVITFGRGVCCAAARNDWSTLVLAPVVSDVTTSRYLAPGAMPSRSVRPEPVSPGRCRLCGSGAIIAKSRPTSSFWGSSPQTSPVGSRTPLTDEVQVGISGIDGQSM